MKNNLEILLIEDNDEHIEIFKDYLEMSYFSNSNVVVTDSIKEGFKILNEKHFDILFLDLSLKDSSIDETIKKISDFANTTPTIVLTSLDDRSTILNIIQNGADDCLPKSEINSFLLERIIQFNIDRREDKDKLKKSQKLLKESETKFKQLADNVDIVFWVRTKDKILYINSTYEKIWGKSCESLIQNPYSFFENIHKDDKDRISKAIDEFQKSGTFNEKYRIVVDNKIKWIKAKAFPILNEKGETIRTAGVAQDITEQKAYEDLLSNFNSTLIQKVEQEVKNRRDKEELLIQQSKMAEMGEMIGAIAHQWKQPLNVLSLICQKMAIKYENGVLNNKDIDKMKEKSSLQIKFMSDTIDNFKNFFKPSKEKKEFFIDESINEVYKLLSAKIKNHNIEFKINQYEQFSILGYHNEFKQVILNIITNAIDAFDEKEIENGEINVFIENDGEIGTIKISDNGGGIQKDLLPNKLFEAYITTKGDKGTGIGLQIAKTIIEQKMNGKIFANNTDIGAEFIIKLQIYKNER